jgi:predicted RNA-binding protein with PIN domain
MDRAHVLYSGAGREADDLIEDLIDRFHRSNPLIVVSSDARLRKAARRRRCERIGSETFLKHLANDAGRPTAARDPHVLRAQVPLDAYSVDTWLRETSGGRAIA